MKPFKLVVIIFLAVMTFIIVSCDKKKSKDDDGNITDHDSLLTDHDSSDEVLTEPDEDTDHDTDTILETGTVSGIIHGEDVLSGAVVKIKKGEDVLGETKSGSDGSYSLEAELEDSEVYCVEVSKGDVELSTCFEYEGEDKVVNVNPVTTVSAMLYKNEKKDLKESDVTSRVYFKIGSGKNLYGLDYTVYEGVSAGFESVKNALGAKGLNEAITSVYNDIISATDIAFNFSYLFNGFIVNAESREIVLEENKSSTAKLYLRTSSEEVADDFDIRWLVPDVAEKEGVHRIEETVSDPGEIPVITRLIYRNKEGSVITLASRTTVITALAVTSSTEIDVEDSDSMVHKKVNDSIFLSFPAGVSVTKDGKPVEKITFKEISNLSGTAISRFILEPSGAVFGENTPLYVTLNLDNLFSGNHSVLFTERISGDGASTILPSSSGDPIMLSASGDPIMSEVFSGDPIMMGDSIMDENMKRALTFTTQHFSRFNNDISSLNFLAVMSAWYSNPELQVTDSDGNSLNPWGFIVRSLEESSNKDAAILSEIFKDSGKTMELSQNLAAIFERPAGSVDNYTIFENYYWIWRFLTDLEENINDPAKLDSKIFPYTEMNLKKMMNFLFTSKTVALRTMTVSDMFRENVGFEIAETTLQNNDLPQMHKNSRKVFLGIPVSETPDSSVITLNSLANSVYMVFNKMLTGIKNPVVHSVPSAPISTDSLFCIWTSSGNDESAYTKCLTKPVKYSLNSLGFLSFPDGTEVTSEEAHAMLIYRFPEIVKASALQKKNVLKALYMFTKYGSKAIVSAGDIESLKKDLYDSVALLLLELRNAIDTVSISEQSAVSDRTVFINNKLENNLSNVHSVSSFDRFLENIKISADSGALSGYAFNRAILTTGSKDIEKIKKDSQNRPVLIYADNQKTETTVHENISHSLFTDRGLRSDTTLFDVFNDIDVSKLNKKLIEAQLTLFYSFKGREYIQKMDYIFSVYPSDELDIITIEPSTIEGSVVDSSSIMPVSGATVILRPGNIISTSDVLGKFIFTNLNAGYYEIEINMDGYLPAMTGTMVTAGEYRVVPAVYMAVEPVEIFTTSVSGSAVNFYTGATVTDVRIVLKKGDGETLSNEIYSSGAFTLENIETGNYSLTASKAGFYNSSVQFGVNENPVTLDPIRLTPAQFCGNGVSETGENCDGNVRECLAISDTYASGLAVCRSNCSGFDLSNCVQRSLCGNGVIEAGEFCDKNTKSCSSISSQYASGTASCSNDCSSWNLTACQGEVTEPVCGDTKVEGTEVCDGDSKTCISINSTLYESGTAQCKNDCKGFNEETCVKKVTQRVTNCTNQLPANASWKSAYTNGQLTQTWNGSNWTPSSDSCEWECNLNYTLNPVSQTCVADQKTFTCVEKPANTQWNTVSSYVQTWSGSAWLPAESTTEYNETASSTSCRYICDSSNGYVRDVSISKCRKCGDGIKEGEEECDDGTNNGQYKLDSPGYCNSTCSGYGEGGYCGDGIVSGPPEVCEIGNTTTCASAGVAGGTGTVKCKTNCTGWNTVPDGEYKCEKLWTCPEKPYQYSGNETEWNVVDSYTQTWTGTAWSPADDNETNYDPTASTTSCRYKCSFNMEWDGEKCVGITRTPDFDCSNYFLPVPGKVLNTPYSYTQTWAFNGASWDWYPPDDTNVDYSAAYVGSSNPCTFRCDLGYHFNPGNYSCDPNSKTWTCPAIPSNSLWNTVSYYTQNWNGSAYEPAGTPTTYNEIPSTTECRFKCAPGYQWNSGAGGLCVPQICGDAALMDKGFEDGSEVVRLYMNEASGATVYDSSGNGNNGTIMNATWTTGKFLSGLNFNGTNAYITLGNPASLQITGNQTISMWVNPADFGSFRMLYGKAIGGEGNIAINTNGTVTYYYGTSGENTEPYQTFTMTSNLTAGGWTHIAVVRDLETMKLQWYKNGVLQNTATALYSSAVVSNADALIGSGPAGYFKGQIDHLRIFAKALSQSEVKLSMGEFCDEGSNNGTYNHCSSTCDGPGPHCGDGIEQIYYELCDSSKLYTGEQLCDKKHGSRTYYPDSTPSCSVTCNVIGICLFCGDGVTQIANGEVCDHGANNGMIGYCNINCSGMVECILGQTQFVECGTDPAKWQKQVCDGSGFWQDFEGCVDYRNTVLCTGQDRCYDNSGEITCPVPEEDFYGQDAQYADLGYCIPKSYTVSGTDPEEIVTDDNTGLEWQRTTPATYSGCTGGDPVGSTCQWQEAIDYCDGLTYGGYSDWRLPTRKELATLPDYGRYNPAIDPDVFPGTKSNYYWSSSSNVSSTTYAWHVNFNNGNVYSTNKSNINFARCVR